MGARMRPLSLERRAVPAGNQPTDLERAQLHKSMIAYAGTYKIAGDRVVHHIEHRPGTMRASDPIRSDFSGLTATD